MKTLDFRPRCEHCRHLIRGKIQEANFARYAPYCSFHCQEIARMTRTLHDVQTLRRSVGGVA